MEESGSDNVDALFGFGGLLDSSIEEIEGLLLHPAGHQHSPPREQRQVSSGSLEIGLSHVDLSPPSEMRGMMWSGPTGGLGGFRSDNCLLSHLRMTGESSHQRHTSREFDEESRRSVHVESKARDFGSDKASYLRYLEEQQRLYTTLLERERVEERSSGRVHDVEGMYSGYQRGGLSQSKHMSLQRHDVTPPMSQYHVTDEGDQYRFHGSVGPQRTNYRKMGGTPPQPVSSYGVEGRFPQHSSHYGMRPELRGGYGAAGVGHRSLPRSHTWSNGSHTPTINGGGDRGPYRNKSPHYMTHGAPESVYWRGNGASFETYAPQKGMVQTGGLKILVVNMKGCLRTFSEIGGGIGILTAAEPPSALADPPVVVAMETSRNYRTKLYDLMSKSAAHVILMVNTGCAGDEDLKTIRSEVKARFKTESAMWASFCSPVDPPCPCSPSTNPSPLSQDNRGTGVLILGPLAPRAGWVRSDGESSFTVNPSTSDLSTSGVKSSSDRVPAVLSPVTSAIEKSQSTINGAHGLPVTSAITSSEKSHSTINGAHGLKYTLATVRIKAGFSDVVFVSCELPLPLPTCLVNKKCERVAQWKAAVLELAGILFEEQKKGKNVFLCGRVIPASVSLRCMKPSVTHMQYLKEFLEIMVRGGVFLLVVTHNGAIELNGGVDGTGDMGYDGVSVFFSAGTIPQQQHLAPAPSGGPKVGSTSQKAPLSVGISSAQASTKKTDLAAMSPKSDYGDSSVIEVCHEDDIFATSPKAAHKSSKLGLNANATPYSSYSFSKSDIGDTFDDVIIVKGTYSNIRSHLLNLNGPCPHDSFVRSIKCGIMNVSDHVQSDDGQDLGTVLELNAEIKGWPRKTFEFVSHRGGP